MDVDVADAGFDVIDDKLTVDRELVLAKLVDTLDVDALEFARAVDETKDAFNDML